jgi:class 3 adenylate cyclase
MSEQRESRISFDLAPDEIASVESFRRLKDTAVLTIMFTDIVGFTELTEEKGERHSNEVRRLHDEVLETTVTEGGAGLVVKHIGDAVMAIFSEPSTAAQRALRIHEGLRRLARDRPDVEALEVKIGLDMGQVTVEEKVDVDVFGRHVNRASRIQGLASGGQVLMSFTVFDSARGWLTGPANDHFEWKSHGRYRLKGVPAPVEIFEVGDPTRAPLRAPRGGTRVRSVPGIAWAAGFVLLGVAATIGYSRLGGTEVWLVDYPPPRSYLDGSSEVMLDGEPGSTERRLLVDVSPGKHVLQYDVADPVRYYAEIDVQRGENHLDPQFTESRLPSLYRYVGLGDDPAEASREGDYVVYDRDNRRLEHHAAMSLAVRVAPGTDEPATAVSSLSWSLALDGAEVANETRAYSHPVDAVADSVEEVEIYSDDHHRYWARIRLVRGYAHLELNSAFLPPRERTTGSSRTP